MAIESDLKKAVRLSTESNEILKKLNGTLSEHLEDDSAHFTIQPGDGLCICYRDGWNAKVGFMRVSIEEFFKLSKEECFDVLDQASI
jgi:hypothetical protein